MCNKNVIIKYMVLIVVLKRSIRDKHNIVLIFKEVFKCQKLEVRLHAHLPYINYVYVY